MISEHWIWNDVWRRGRATIWKILTFIWGVWGRPRRISVKRVILWAEIWSWDLPTSEFDVSNKRKSMLKRRYGPNDMRYISIKGLQEEIRYCLARSVASFKRYAVAAAVRGGQSVPEHNSVFWDMTPCSRVAVCRCHKGRSQARSQQQPASRHRRQHAGHMLWRPYATLFQLSGPKQMPQLLQRSECSRPKLDWVQFNEAP
jgi:hypothetical protein